MTRRLLVVLATAAGMLVVAPSASGVHDARPSGSAARAPLYASVAGSNRVEPIVANGNINTANGASPTARSASTARPAPATRPRSSASRTTSSAPSPARPARRSTPDLGQAIDQTVRAEGRVEDLSAAARRPAGPTLGVGAANSTAAGKCVARHHDAAVRRRRARSRTSRSAARRSRSTGSSTQLTNILNPLLGALVEIKVNEQIRDGGLADGQRAARQGHPRQRHAARRPRRRPRQGRRQRRRSATRASRTTARGDRRGQVCPPGSVLDVGAQPLRHPGRHRRLEPRRDHRRPAVPGSERRHASSRSTSPASATATARA